MNLFCSTVYPWNSNVSIYVQCGPVQPPTTTTTMSTTTITTTSTTTTIPTTTTSTTTSTTTTFLPPIISTRSSTTAYDAAAPAYDTEPDSYSGRHLTPTFGLGFTTSPLPVSTTTATATLPGYKLRKRLRKVYIKHVNKVNLYSPEVKDTPPTSNVHDLSKPAVKGKLVKVTDRRYRIRKIPKTNVHNKRVNNIMPIIKTTPLPAMLATPTSVVYHNGTTTKSHKSEAVFHKPKPPTNGTWPWGSIGQTPSRPAGNNTAGATGIP